MFESVFAMGVFAQGMGAWVSPKSTSLILWFKKWFGYNEPWNPGAC